MTTRRWLRLYLQDHYGASTGGVALFRRVGGSHSDPQAARAVTAMAEEIETDQAALAGIMSALDVDPSVVKQSLMWVGEKVGRLMTNGTLVRRSPLTDVLELEALSVAVEAKLRGWKLLQAVAAFDSRVDKDLMAELVGRAEGQRDTLEELRLDVGTRVMTGAGSG